MGDAKEHVIDAEKRNTREACSAWPPAGLCGRCHGNGGWYSRLGPVDWDWTTCQECRGTGSVPGGCDAVENCCGGRWLTTRTEELAVGISRTHIACSGCGQRRILTVTNRPAPHGLEVVA